MKEIQEWEDISITAVFETVKDGFAPSVSFKLYELIGEYNDGEKTYELRGATSSSETTANLEDAQTLIDGHIKWDGCSHVTFGDDEGYIHMCGFSSWKQMHEAIARTWEYARLKLSQDHTKDEFDESLVTHTPITNEDNLK